MIVYAWSWWPAQKDPTQFMVVNYQNLMEEGDKIVKDKTFVLVSH